MAANKGARSEASLGARWADTVTSSTRKGRGKAADLYLVSPMLAPATKIRQGTVGTMSAEVQAAFAGGSLLQIFHDHSRAYRPSGSGDAKEMRR